ncbi:hypothetical protein GALMADRAFT_147984 [Galerina marginata CBS 339.88]|uniref:Uncharacterized protein n=1 Tax=Galerina marginata (strain CBS 339.88) TaxID=685588 RepID=A0A067S6E6_GALM3|nr:hypothetical protein GALMADRAFT_147984 [Galerina marginata CBS 339.88]
MSQPDPYGFNAQCDTEFSDTQLMTDTFANIINATFTFRCCTFTGLPNSCADQTGPPFESCGDTSFSYLTLCIGGIFEQHACAASGCQKISPVVASSQQCAQPLVDYMKVQPVGAQYACCDSTSCTLGTDYSCANSRILQLCIGDKDGTECVNPSTSAICSGNYTSAAESTSPGSVTSPGSITSPGSVTSPIPLSLSSPSSSSHSGLSASDVATIVGSTLGGITSIVAVVLAVYKIRQVKKKKLRQEA